MPSTWKGEPIKRQIRWRYCWWLPTRSEIRSAYYDLRARMGGWCNHNPMSASRGGAYSWGRCQLRHGHTGMHRDVNYVWEDDGKVSYLPTPPGHTDQVMKSPWPRKHSACGGYRRRIVDRRNDRKHMREVAREARDV